MKLIVFIVIASLVADALAQEERKVMRRRKVLPSTADVVYVVKADADVDNAPDARNDESHYRIKKQMRPEANVERKDDNIPRDFF